VRIAFLVTRADAIGGVQVHVRDLCAALLEDGHDPVVLVGGCGPYTDDLARARIPHVPLRHLKRPLRFPVRPLEDGRALCEMVRVLRKLSPDLVSAHSTKAGGLGRLAAWKLGLPVLFTAHGWAFAEGVPRPSAFVYRWAERVASPLADRIVTVSDFDRALAVRHRVAAADRVVTIHNGVHDVPESSRASPGVQPPRLIMVARFERQKDHATLLRALARLQDLVWHADLVGDGPQRAATERMAHELGLAARVGFLGARHDVAACLAQAQLFVLTTHWEGLPRTVLEAMRAGLPVVATDVGGIGELVRDGESGFLVPRGDPEALAERLRHLIVEPQRRLELGRNGRQRFERGFTFQRMYEETLALYRSVLEGRSSRTT